jgi:alkanesulfonate monooxygenase SsuD/methylene tetrahydromethanopterin reductase-like flavin-dependent oxidoreductase (luciferase family)
VGFDAFSMGDHYNIAGLQRLNQVPALARLCAEAKHCDVGAAVMLFGLHHPVSVASELASLDVLNEGKSFFAIGLGYRDDELNAFNLTKAQRFHRFVEGVEIIKRLWTENNVSFDGAAFKLRNVSVDPKPLQKPRPVIWIAANSDVAVARATIIGDGWMIGRIPPSMNWNARWSSAAKRGAPPASRVRLTYR